MDPWGWVGSCPAEGREIGGLKIVHSVCVVGKRQLDSQRFQKRRLLLRIPSHWQSVIHPISLITFDGLDHCCFTFIM